MVRPTDVFAGLVRLALVVFALAGTRQIYLEGETGGLAYFTNLTGFAVALTFAWAGFALLIRGIQPPSWLKGGVTLFAAVTGLIAYFVLAPEAADAPHAFLGLTDGQIEHQLVPIGVVADFLLFDAHRRMRLRYAGYWFAAVVVYFVVTLVRGAVDPAAGYPYGFIDVAANGYGKVGVNAVVCGAGIYALALVIYVVDRVLPTTPIIGSGVGTRPGGGAALAGRPGR